MPENPEISAQTLWTIRLIAIGVGVMTIWLIGWAGQLGERAIASAPIRRGGLGLIDAGLGLLLVLGGPLLVGSVGVAAGLEPKTDPSDFVLLMLIGQLAAIPALGFALYRVGKTMPGGLKSFGFNLQRPGRIAGLAGLGLLVVLAINLGLLQVITILAELFDLELPTIAHTALTTLIDSRSVVVRVAIVGSAVVIAPIFEEIIFRGLLQSALQQGQFVNRRWAAIGLSAVIFTSIHLGAIPVYATAPLFVLSLGLGYVYEKTGSLVTPIAMHMLFNGLNITVVLILISQQQAG
jgi:membrane protease YdiL (CAAX protease family)